MNPIEYSIISLPPSFHAILNSDVHKEELATTQCGSLNFKLHKKKIKKNSYQIPNNIACFRRYLLSVYFVFGLKTFGVRHIYVSFHYLTVY